MQSSPTKTTPNPGTSAGVLQRATSRMHSGGVRSSPPHPAERGRRRQPDRRRELLVRGPRVAPVVAVYRG
jgi:hypothetical protein